MDYLQPATSEANQVVRTGAYTLVLKQLPDAPLSLDGGPHELNTNPTPSPSEQRPRPRRRTSASNRRPGSLRRWRATPFGTGRRSVAGFAAGAVTLQPMGSRFR